MEVRLLSLPSKRACWSAAGSAVSGNLYLWHFQDLLSVSWAREPPGQPPVNDWTVATQHGILLRVLFKLELLWGWPRHHQTGTAVRGSSHPALFLAPLLSRVSDTHHIWRLSLPALAPPFLYFRDFYLTGMSHNKSLAFLTLSQCFFLEDLIDTCNN